MWLILLLQCSRFFITRFRMLFSYYLIFIKSTEVRAGDNQDNLIGNVQLFHQQNNSQWFVCQKELFNQVLPFFIVNKYLPLFKVYCHSVFFSISSISQFASFFCFFFFILLVSFKNVLLKTLLCCNVKSKDWMCCILYFSFFIFYLNCHFSTFTIL